MSTSSSSVIPGLKQTGGSTDTDRSDFVSSSVYDQNLRHIWTQHFKSSFRMPWERTLNTPWEVCKRLRTNDMEVSGAIPPLPVATPRNTEDASHIEVLNFKQVGIRAVKGSDDRLLSEKLSWERKCAYKKWLGIILTQVGCFEVGRLQAACKSMEFAKGGLIESIKDALGPKATSTIHARASPVLQYIQFCKDRGIEPFPLVEHTCYDYVKSCEGRAATYTRSFLLSLSFANYHFGVQGADVVLGSSRIRGLVNTLFAQKRKLVQRPPLTVKQIMKLEETVLDNRRSKQERLASGFFLFLLMGRLRFSDGQQICQLTLDQQDDGFGFVEALAAKTKTSVSLDRKTRHLPVAVPLLTFGDTQWLPTWLDLRQKELGAQANSIDEFIPLLPSPTMKGWSKMPLGVTSGANWLRSLLQGVEPEKGTPVGTHSLKATLLSMSAKYGMNHGVRKLLGYHAGSKNQSMLCYSRDAMAEPLRQMCQMIQEVKAGRFLPDCSRSGRFPAVAESEIPKEQDELSESSSSGSENEEEVDHVQEEAACASVVGTWRPSKDERLETAIFVRHKVSRCIHAFADESGIEFTRGRKMANTYEVLSERPGFFHPACSSCFRDAA